MAKLEKPQISGDKKKLYALAGLLGILVLAAAWNFWPKKKVAPPPPPQTADDGRVRNSDLKNAQNQEAANPSAAGPATGREHVFGPIEVLPVLYVPSANTPTPRRNIFDYPPPPIPKPPPRQPDIKAPPPTINLGSISPTSTIAGTSKPITLTLSGNLFPGDAQVLFGGQPIPSQRLGATIIKATIPPSAIGVAGSRDVEVKSASQPQKLWSTKIPFQLTASPDPSSTFAYSGRVGGQAVITFKEPNKRPQLVSVGGTIPGEVPWKVLAINDKQIDVLDTRNEIRKSLSMVAKSR